MSDFRLIPSIELLRQRPSVRALEIRFGADATVAALRAAAADVRVAIAGGNSELSSEAAVVGRVEAVVAKQLSDAFRPSLQPVINATGVIIHTNLGRAPLAESAIDRVAEVARGYSSLEYDLGRGARGKRDVHAEALLCRLTGAEAAIVVNNNAAATMLMLAALAAGVDHRIAWRAGRNRRRLPGAGVMAVWRSCARSARRTRRGQTMAPISEHLYLQRPPVKFSDRGSPSGRLCRISSHSAIQRPHRRGSRKRPGW
jgi:hypothetical protein